MAWPKKYFKKGQ